MNEQEKQIFTSDNLKETAIMTIAVGIIAAAVYFFLIPSMTSISSISALIYDKKAAVLSVLGTYFNGIVLDHFSAF